MTELRRPVLRWHGGKWKLAPWILSHFPHHRVYVEPYGGAGSVLMRKPRCQAEIYNDLDDNIVNIFQILRDPEKAEKLAKLLRLTPFSRTELEKAYEPAEGSMEQARRTLIRSYMAFGADSVNPKRKTGFRKAAIKRGQVPSMDWKNYPEEIFKFTERIQGVLIEKKNALELIVDYDTPETLFYVDPPYVHSSRNVVGKNKGYVHEMTDSDHVNLAQVLKKLKGKVLLSGYHSPLYDGLYGGWKFYEKQALTAGQTKKTEVLWVNDAAIAAQGNLF